MSDPRVVVVGGGLAGLSAALACADGGARVTLLEARPRLGGATFSFRRDGLWVDNGQHVFLRCFTAYRGFLDRIGSADRVRLQDRMTIPVLSPGRPVAWLRRGRLPAPLHMAGALARYGMLTPVARVRAARAARALSKLDLDDSLDGRTFRSWLVERGQSPEAIEALWNLIALPALNLDARHASLSLAAKVFQTGLLDERSAADIGYARVPLSAAHGEAAARALRSAGAQVRLRALVGTIEPSAGGRHEIVTGEDRLEADAVVVAVPHLEAAGLLPPGAIRDPAGLGRLGTSPIVNVHVVYDRRVTDLPFAAGVRSPVQWVFDRTEQSGLGEGQYLAVSISGAHREVEERTEELRRRFLPAMVELFPRAGGARVTRFFVTRERAATFRQSPGTGSLRPTARTGIPGLFLAGAWTATGWPATMEGAVRSGLAAASQALRAVGRARVLPAEVAG